MTIHQRTGKALHPPRTPPLKQVDAPEPAARASRAPPSSPLQQLPQKGAGMDYLTFFSGKPYQINSHLSILHPTLQQICEYGEERYYSLVFKLTSAPADYKVMLYDAGVMYDEISDFELFTILAGQISREESSILLGDLDLSSFKPALQNTNSQLVLWNPETDCVIDKALYERIAIWLRTMHRLTKNAQRPGNPHTRKILVELDREELRKQQQRRRRHPSVLLPLVSSLTNCDGFKYGFKKIWDIPIGVLFDAAARLQKIENYRNLMRGVYSGCVNVKEISANEFNWMGEL